jgi:hypothetical protein
MKKQNRFDSFISQLLYKLLIGSRTEDYVSEEKGKTVITPCGIWQDQIVRQRG